MSHLRKSEYLIRPIPLSEMRPMVEQWHYARGGSNTGVYLHGLFGPAGLVGGAWWLPPTKVAALSVSPDWRCVLSLTRLVIAPDEPTNAASFLLGRSIRAIRADGRFHSLVTYADTGEGHTGAIYRATNWDYMGLSRGEPRYIDPGTGRHVARKSASHSRSRAEMEALGYRWTPATPKHKYVMHLRKADR